MRCCKTIVAIVCSATALLVTANAQDYEVSVCRLQSHSNSSQAYLQPCETWVSKNQCQNGIWVTWDTSKFEGQLMYSTAMAAMLAEKTVTLRLDGASCNSYDITTMIRINK